VIQLGIVREVLADDDGVDVLVTPPYSGCPATEAIERPIREALSAPGARAAETTQPLAFVPRIACPRCGSRDTERLSQFGATACKALHRCRACREPFEYFKPL
jgi:ring-1,2-phenylacetyl-CoA epoxidase subunit PaaD